MAVTLYQSSDTSAPALGATNTGVYPVISLLQACLVDGYGSKAAAGWTKPFDDAAGTAVFKAGGGNQACLWVSDVDSSIDPDHYAAVVGYRSMTAIDVGTDRFPTSAQENLAKITKTDGSNVGRGWAVVANDRSFYLSTWDSVGGSFTYLHFFGDFVSSVAGDTGNVAFAALPGHDEFLDKWSGITGQHNVIDEVFTDPSLDGLYLLTDYGNASVSVPFIPGALSGLEGNEYGDPDFPGYPDPITGGLLLDYARIVEVSKVIRGRLPGGFGPLHNMSGLLNGVIDGGGTFAGKSFYVAPSGAGGSLCISLDEADW
jgi:hypothetical protein